MSYLMKYLLVLVIFTEEIYCGSHLMKCLQPDDLICGDYDNPKHVADHICARECIPGDCRTCYWRFTVEAYSCMNGACGRCPNVTSDCYGHHCITCDGFEKSVLCINRQLPGPLIEVCEGDHIIVDVKNSMQGRGTTIHWHGIRQLGTNYMDGVPMVTQCPIMESQIYRYHYKATHSGVFFYHSHSGLQKADGVVGPLVVKGQKSKDPNCNEYDLDQPSHTVLVQDWFHDCADCRFPGLQTRGPTQRQQPDTYLINGKGQYINGTNGIDVPLAMFNVTKGKRHVFRIIAGTCLSCQVACGIEKHYLTIIGSDGQPTKPYKVTSCTISPGERMRVVVNCNQPVGSYWMHCRTVGFCQETRAYQLAIVRYRGHSGIPSTPKPGYDDVEGVNDIYPTVNPVGSNCTKESEVELGPCIADLRHACETPKQIYEEPCKTIILALGFHAFPNNTPYTNTTWNKYPKFIAPGPGGMVGGTINGCSHVSAPCTLLSQWWEVPTHLFCKELDIDEWNNDVHECINVAKAPSHCCVQLLIFDTNDIGLEHPFHLHGYDMYILAQGKLSEFGNFTSLKDKVAALKKHMSSAERKPIPRHCPQKDTVALTSGGYIVARIYTDNKGCWFFHCHFAFHLDSGMAGVLVVGSEKEFPPPPKGFPRCGDYLPKLDDCGCHSCY